MSMAPVAAAISGNGSGAMKSKIQFIAWPGPAMKPSSDIDLFTTTLPFPVLVSLILLLRRTVGCSVPAPLGPPFLQPLAPGRVQFEFLGGAKQSGLIDGAEREVRTRPRASVDWETQRS